MRRLAFILLALFFIFPAHGQFINMTSGSGGEFVFQSVQSSLDKLTTTLKGTVGRSIRVDWGDGSFSAVTFTGSDQTVEHEYSGTGTYSVSITGSIGNLNEFTCNEATLQLSLGQLANLSGLTNFSSNISNSITGNLSSIPRTVTTFSCAGLNTVSGDIANLPVDMKTFSCAGLNTISDYTSGRTWANNMRLIFTLPATSYGLASAEIDSLLVDLAKVATWTSDKKIDMTGNNAARSSASDAAKATLEGKGVTVLTN